MTGAQHYKEAEGILEEFRGQSQVQLALVHATLALAAATAISGEPQITPTIEHGQKSQASPGSSARCLHAVPSLFRQTTISGGNQREPTSGEIADQTA